ncbi:MAG: PEGA domain-containing protein [Acidobacteria bacterium]|nr:PEGA domain-containing protein [Acidobacteriota bacterium]
MNRRVLVVALVAAVLVGGSVLFFVVSQPSPEEPQPVSTPRASARSRAPAPARGAAPAPSEPAPRREKAEPPPPPAAEAAPAAPAAEPAAPTLGRLRIAADVAGAQVFIDRRFVGAAPAVAEDITPGTHQLNVAAEGFDSVAMPIEVAAGEREIVVKLREVRLDSHIDVVHRHGVGSCRGRLVATPQGLRYETSNRDDAFAAPLADLETFQVDYLAKNLRVKLPKGRQFNFTDPDGNADRLFVFHREVEKARDRIRKGDTPAVN